MFKSFHDYVNKFITENNNNNKKEICFAATVCESIDRS